MKEFHFDKSSDSGIPAAGGSGNNEPIYPHCLCLSLLLCHFLPSHLSRPHLPRSAAGVPAPIYPTHTSLAALPDKGRGSKTLKLEAKRCQNRRIQLFPKEGGAIAPLPVLWAPLLWVPLSVVPHYVFSDAFRVMQECSPHKIM